jgi:hypothetical protein
MPLLRFDLIEGRSESGPKKILDDARGVARDPPGTETRSLPGRA